MISHIAQAWILPPGLNIFFILLGFIIFKLTKRLGFFFIIFGCLSLWAFSTPKFAYNLINVLQKRYSILTNKTLANPPSNSAIVILGGGSRLEAEYDNKPTVSDFTFKRVKYGAYLYHQTKLPLIVSGGNAEPDGIAEAKLMEQTLNTLFKVPVSYLESHSTNTVEESRYLTPYFKQDNIQHIYLVTDAWHMPRSIYIFQCAGISVTPAPMGHFTPLSNNSIIEFMPSAEALKVSALALREWIGMTWYYVLFNQQCQKK